MSLPSLAPGEQRAYEANIARFFAYSTLQHFQLWMPIWIIYLQQQRGLSLTEITFLDVPFFLTQVLAEVPTGALADRFGRKASLLLGAAAVTLGIFVFGIADNYPLILVSYVFWGVGMTMQSGADQAFLYDSLKLLGRETDYSRIYGRVNAFTLGAVVFAGLIGAPLAAGTSLATPVIVSAFIYAASALVAVSFKEPPVQEGRTPYLQTMSAGFAEVAGRPAVRLAMLFGVVASFSFFVPQYFMQPYLKGHGVSTASLGLVMMPVRLVSVGASLAAHGIQKRFGLWNAIALTPAVSVSVCLGLAAWDSLYAFALVPVAAAAGTTRMLLMSHYINARIPSERRATVISIYALAIALAAALGAPLFGYLADQRSLRFLYGAVGLFCAGGLPFILLAWRRSDHGEQPFISDGARLAQAAISSQAPGGPPVESDWETRAQR